MSQSYGKHSSDINKYMRENCPETCKVQYKNIKDLGGSGILSICSRQGRCKSPLDNDPSNLLPICNRKNSYKQGSDDKCKNYLTIDLEGDLKGKPCNSNECKRSRCLMLVKVVYLKEELKKLFI